MSFLLLVWSPKSPQCLQSTFHFQGQDSHLNKDRQTASFVCIVEDLSLQPLCWRGTYDHTLGINHSSAKSVESDLVWKATWKRTRSPTCKQHRDRFYGPFDHVEMGQISLFVTQHLTLNYIICNVIYFQTYWLSSSHLSEVCCACGSKNFRFCWMDRL